MNSYVGRTCTSRTGSKQAQLKKLQPSLLRSLDSNSHSRAHHNIISVANLNHRSIMSCHSIVRIGPLNSDDGCYATLLRSSITNYFSSSSSNEDNDTKNDPHRLAISNRYFDASVAFTGLNQSTDYFISASESAVEDGIILVFDSSLSASQAGPFLFTQ